MIKQLTIKKNIAIEAVKYCPASEDLELVGTKPLKNYSDQLKYAIDAGSITDATNFKDTFGYNNNFFYVLEVVNNQVVDGYERGVGYIYEKDGRTLLKRIAPLYSGKNSADCSVCRDICGKSFAQMKMCFFTLAPQQRI